MSPSLPSSHMYRVISPTRVLHREAKVSELGAWKEELLHEVFLPHQVEEIMSIPQSAIPQTDKRIWVATNNGKFTVSSAYRLIRGDEERGTTESVSNDLKMKLIWKKIWRMKTPNKIQNFSWRACRNILATKDNLRRRHIISKDLCDDCGRELETCYHMFQLCEKAMETWSNSKLSFPFTIQKNWDFTDVVWQISNLSGAVPGLLEKTITICWDIWKNRNVVRHGGSRRPGLNIIKLALTLVKDYTAANKQPTSQQPDEVVQWKPPSANRYKVNVDGGPFSATKMTRLGVLIRDEKGQVMAAISKKIHVPLDALAAEAKAMETSIQFTWDMGFREVSL